MGKKKSQETSSDPALSIRDKNVEEWLFWTNSIYSEDLVELDDECEQELLCKVTNRTYFTVVMYDIVENKRRSKVARILLGYGERVQYSGFEGHLTSKQVETLKAKLKKAIDHDSDRVRIYRMAGKPQVTVFGAIPIIEEANFTII